MSLGEKYLKNFKVGDYVRWRRLVSSPVEYYQEYFGLILQIIEYNDELYRPVHYAQVLENQSNQTFYIVLSCLTKVETN
jgi:hypothetical protein